MFNNTHDVATDAIIRPASKPVIGFEVPRSNVSERVYNLSPKGNKKNITPISVNKLYANKMRKGNKVA